VPDKVRLVRQSLARDFCELFLNSGLTQVGLNNVWQGVSVCGWIGKDMKLLDSIIFTLSNTPLIIVQYSYTQEI
jgi:hypothetical protein